MTLTTSVTSPKSQAAGKKVFVDVLHLDDIPGAMDKMGWKMSARMMRWWFDTKPAYRMPLDVRGGKIPAPPSQYEDQIIKMNWVLNYPRCVEPFERIVMNWHTPAALKQLRNRLIGAGWTPGSNVTLGAVTMTARELDRLSQVNFTDFGATLDTLDDMYGALGKASFKIAVVGRSKSSPTAGDVFEIDKLGIYVRDTYDFNDDGGVPEPLGIWNKERCLSKAETAAYLGMVPVQIARTFQGFVPVFNSDFRRWQQAHNSGGDFVVFSDVKWVVPPVSVVKIP